jgi:uncharacterized NAD(P)/FAD-binding protein YdhS
VALSLALQDIVRELDSRRDSSPAALASALRRPLSIDDVAPYIRFDPHNYVRSLVTEGQGWELRLLCWRPKQTSSFHGHGDSACAFRVLRGSAVETILGSRDRVLAPGDVVPEDGPELVHQVGNAGADALLSLHAYSPALPVDAPSPREGRSVVIVGGGLSGVALATHLLRRADSHLRILLVERGPWLGRGVAYGVESQVFRLNVPASKMSIDPEQPDDFVKWANAGTTPNAFLPRTLYAAYVVQRFRDALRASPGKLRIIRGEAARIEREAVVLSDGSRLSAEFVVLATGLSPRLVPSTLPEDARIIDAWDECAIAGLPRTGNLLVLGAGLTALDVLGLMDACGFSGKATVLSRRGLLPRPHLRSPHHAAPLPREHVESSPKNLRDLLAWGRKIVRAAEARGEPWQAGIDAIRPHVSQLWRGLSPKDRARFVRSVRPYWDVLRHRAPVDAHLLIEKWRASDRIEILAGSVSRCEARPEGLDVEVRTAGGKKRLERYEAIVRCIGPALERSEADTPLVHHLIESGRAEADPAGLGIATDELGRVVGPGGRGDPSLFALGALRRASSWETTSVPDISVHALAIAKRIIP